MTPETEALIARVRKDRDTMDGIQDPNDRRFRLANASIVVAAPQLATALETESKRADAAEAKLEVAREALERSEALIKSLGADLSLAQGQLENEHDDNPFSDGD